MHRACSIAVAGGGISGLSCAHKLLQLLPNAQASVIDMGRSGPGGRASTRRRDGLQFDHGCQFMRVRAPADAQDAAAHDFADQMQLWQREGAIAQWDSSRLGLLEASTSQFTPRTALQQQQQQQSVAGGFCRLLAPGDIFVGAPSMDALCTALAAQHGDRLKRIWNSKVRQLEEDSSGGYSLIGTAGGADGEPSSLGRFDAVVLSDAMAGRSGSPGHITSASDSVRQLLAQLSRKRAAPRLTLMAAFPAGAVAAPFDSATVSGSVAIEWLSNDSAKPGRQPVDGVQCWTAVSTEKFARRAIDQDLPLQIDGKFNRPDNAAMTSVTSEMLEHMAGLLAPFATGGNSALRNPLHASAQRWGSALYPLPDEDGDDPSSLLLATPDGRVAVVGDCVAGSEVQRCVAHAHATARALCRTLTGVKTWKTL